MYHRITCVMAAFLGVLLVAPASAGVIYNNLTPNNLMGTASRPGSPGVIEIESADDFPLTTAARLTGAHFTGLLVSATGAAPTITQLVLEIYRIFPLDSALPGGGGIRVPTRANSPSDVEFDGRDSNVAGDLTFSTTQIAATFTVLNSVQPGGIHTLPANVTNGNGPLTGQEVQVDVSLTKPINLVEGHYFFIPQVAVSGGTFYWLSGSRPISGAGTTPFPAGITDLQSWTRDANLDPDWLRIGADIVGGANPPAFNASFALDGTVIPEPGSLVLFAGGSALLLIGIRRKQK